MKKFKFLNVITILFFAVVLTMMACINTATQGPKGETGPQGPAGKDGVTTVITVPDTQLYVWRRDIEKSIAEILSGIAGTHRNIEILNTTLQKTIETFNVRIDNISARIEELPDESLRICLEWRANTETDIAGYSIYVGHEPGIYDANIDVGNSIQYWVFDLRPNTTYYFAAKAYNTQRMYSDFSKEVSVQL